MATVLKNISEIRRFFHRNEDPVYFISATNFNLLGLDEWVKNFKYICYIDCYGGKHPNVFCPSEQPHAEFQSIEDINKDYSVEVGLPGDAKLTLRAMIETSERVPEEIAKAITASGFPAELTKAEAPAEVSTSSSARIWFDAPGRGEKPFTRVAISSASLPWNQRRPLIQFGSTSDSSTAR